MPFRDPVIEAYKSGIDITLIRETLKLTPQQRSERFKRAMALCFELQKASRRRRVQQAKPARLPEPEKDR